MPVRSGAAGIRALMKKGKFIFMPVAYDPLGGRLVESLGFRATYTGGFATGGSRCVTEPMLTLREQVDAAGDVANAVGIPTLADGGAGFGEPMRAMRAVREFIRAGVAGIHIEDQLYPKRAHYHKYVARAVPAREFVDKIRMACRQRDETDGNFVIIARSDTARFRGVGEAVRRVNMAADAGADMGLVFPRSHKEALAAPGKARIPLVYVQSRGNRDARPLYSERQMAEMSYAACIDAVLYLAVSFHFMKKALREVRKTGDYSGMTHEGFVAARQEIEDLIGPEEFYEIEEQTVERKKWGKR